MKIGILCNGIGDEKSLSIHSAKMLHEIFFHHHPILVFMESISRFFILSSLYLYSNTFEDFLHYYLDKKPINNIILYLQSFDYLFLVSHGEYGEDGGLQQFLTNNDISYIGPTTRCASLTFDKSKTMRLFWEHEICNPWFCEIYQDPSQLKTIMVRFPQLCIKPNQNGSSIGVGLFNSVETAILHAEHWKKKGIVLLEEIHHGREFTVSLFQKKVISITEIITTGIYSYEKKYFPSQDVQYNYTHAFSRECENEIKKKALQVFDFMDAQYFLRIDGFILSKDSSIIFTDTNSIPSFDIHSLFLKNQNHYQLFYSLTTLPPPQPNPQNKWVFVLMGGDSNEADVSLLSGNNVYFHLYNSKKYYPIPVYCRNNRYYILQYKEAFQSSVLDYNYFLYEKDSLDFDQFVTLIKSQNNSIVFIALHGGNGEDGRLQRMFEKEKILFTGSNSWICCLCMNKKLVFDKFPEISLPFQVVDLRYSLPSQLYQNKQSYINWNNNKKFIKPNADGSSFGACSIPDENTLLKYQDAWRLQQKKFQGITMSLNQYEYIISPYVPTDKIRVENGNLHWEKESGWLEGTIGFIGDLIFPPSICLNESGLLSLEEKFMSGKGINLTPPPLSIWDSNNIDIIKNNIRIVKNKLNITSYARIDFFYHAETRQFILIEINTLPGLTPATVFFQQAIQLDIYPLECIERILEIHSSKPTELDPLT